MAFEERRGRSYYYSKTRTGHRVVSTYHGGGEIAELLAANDQAERSEKELAAAAERFAMEAIDAVDKGIDEAFARYTQSSSCQVHREAVQARQMSVTSATTTTPRR